MLTLSNVSLESGRSVTGEMPIPRPTLPSPRALCARKGKGPPDSFVNNTSNASACTSLSRATGAEGVTKQSGLGELAARTAARTGPHQQKAPQPG